jgi:transcriptional regulator with XRE-family HTH domain
MGSASRIKPELLAAKLLAIRNKLDLSQTGMADSLSCKKIKIKRTDVTRYETGIREPALHILLRYSRLAGVTVEMLIDDEIELSF